MNTLPLALSSEDQRLLRWARDQLERPPFVIRMAQVIGAPVRATFGLLPHSWHRQLQRIALFSIRHALALALADLGEPTQARARLRHYKQAAILAGGMAGFFGGALLLVELPFTTLLMLKSIAEIARSQGEDLNAPETRLACIEVFALGGGSEINSGVDTGYYSLRLGLAWSKGNVLQSLIETGLKFPGAPAVTDWVTNIARRFGVALSEKLAVQLAPVVGAVGGATINAVFIEHFQAVARGHFTVRRLERKYGPTLVQTAYEHLANPSHGPYSI